MVSMDTIDAIVNEIMAKNGLAHIEKNLLKYIPKKAWKYLVWLDKDCGNYLVAFDLKPFDSNAKEDWQEYCDTVDELRWTARQFIKEYGIK